jgi:hypothetical protein
MNLFKRNPNFLNTHKFIGNNNRKKMNQLLNTVKLGYNELGYSELPLIANKFQSLVGFQYFVHLFSRL